MWQVAAELGIAGSTISLGDSRVRTMAGRPVNEVSLGNLHGKSGLSMGLSATYQTWYNGNWTERYARFVVSTNYPITGFSIHDHNATSFFGTLPVIRQIDAVTFDVGQYLYGNVPPLQQQQYFGNFKLTFATALGSRTWDNNGYQLFTSYSDNSGGA